MKRIQAGIVGAGFVGPLHLDAVRRLGYADVIGVAQRDETSARQKAAELGLERSYGSYEAMMQDPDIDVVHVCTPNHLHLPVALAAIAAGKHVICDKPLATTAREARQMRDAAEEAGVVHAVTYNYRFNPMVQQARAMIARGDVGTVRFVHGQYLQDWLLYDTDYSWRVETEKGGAAGAIGDIGSHWMDTAQFISGLRIEMVLAELTTAVPVRMKPSGSRHAFQAAADEEAAEPVEVQMDDLATVLVRFEGGGRGVFAVGQVCAGHDNDQRVEVNGSKASLAWRQEEPNSLWVGYRDQANRVLPRDPSLLDASARAMTVLPGGHPEGWSDAFRNLMDAVYSQIRSGRVPARGEAPYPTFEDGYRSCCLIEAVMESGARGGWVEVGEIEGGSHAD